MPNQTWTSVLKQQSTDGPGLSAASRASCLSSYARWTMPAGFFWYVGQQLQVKASGIISSVITTPGTARFDLDLGGIVIADGLAVLLDTAAAHSNVGWVLDMILTLRQIGSSATFTMAGTWACEDILGTPASAPKGSLTAILPWNSSPANGGAFDSETPAVLDLKFTQTVATGSMTLKQYSLIALN